MHVLMAAHHFPSQEVCTIENPLALEGGPEDVLFVSTANHIILVLDGKTGNLAKPAFSTVDAATLLCYSKTGDYVAALESRLSACDDTGYVRVYVNWRSEDRTQPIRARIAARVSPSRATPENTLEMVEIPVEGCATAIACCQITGNLAIACGRRVCVHRYVVRRHDSSKFSYCDFEPLLDMEFDYAVAALRLCEDVLVCSGSSQLRVVQLCAPPVPTPTAAAVHWPPATPVAVNNADADNNDSLSQPVVWDTRIGAPAADNTAPCRTLPLLHLPRLHQPLHSVACDGDAVWPRLVAPSDSDAVRLHCCLYWREPDAERLLPAALLLTPFYRTQDKDHSSTAETERPDHSADLSVAGALRSSHHRHLSGISVFFSAAHEGRTYLLPTGRVPLCALHVGTHAYTAPLQLAVRQQHLLHALTADGLESCTVRDTRLLVSCGSPGHPVSSHRQTVCLLSLRQFVNVTHMSVTDTRLALVTSSDGGESSTLYLLQLMDRRQLSAELSRLSQTHGQDAASMSRALLDEALMTLCPDVLWSGGDTPDEHQLVDAAYRQSCADIAHFLLRSVDPVDWRQAGEWFLLSGEQLSVTLDRAWDTPGLLSHLEVALMRPPTGPPAAPQLPHTRPPAAPQLPYSTANRALSLLIERRPTALAAVLLSASGALLQYRAEPPLEALLSLLEDPSASATEAQRICLAALSLLPDAERAASLLARLEGATVALMDAHLLLQRPAAVSDDVTLTSPRLTEMALLLLETHARALSGRLAELCAVRQMSLCDLLAALVQAADTANRTLACRLQVLLRDVLEAYYSMHPIHKSGRYQPVAITLLVRAYLGSMTASTSCAEPPAAAAVEPLYRPLKLFGPRAAWLNQLPPFSGPPQPAQLLQQPSLINLLLLQSLLHAGLASEEDRSNIVQFLSGFPELAGADSLRLLCSDLQHSVSMLLDKYPHVTLEFAKSVCDGPEDWRLVLTLLSAARRDRLLAAEDTGELDDQLAALLEYLSDELSPDQLTAALPDAAAELPDGPDALCYRRCVRRCSNLHRAALVRQQLASYTRERAAS